jgi:UDP-N-acetylmuramoyl-tripeptide--D-alanyl-D-alanine ligase
VSQTASVNRAEFTLNDLVVATNGEVVTRGNTVSSRLFNGESLQGVSTDTRTIVPNSLFVALRGEKFDAHNFLSAAREAGASAALVENADNAPHDLVCVQVKDILLALGDLARCHRRRFSLPVIGVTGSYGKTTTRALIAAALSPLGRVLSSSGNFNNEIGVPQTLFK